MKIKIDVHREKTKNNVCAKLVVFIARRTMKEKLLFFFLFFSPSRLHCYNNY